MTRTLLTLSMLSLALNATSQEEKKKDERAKIDEAVRDFKLKDAMKDEETFVTLSEFKDKKVVVLFFVSDKCTVTWAYEKRIGKLVTDLRKQDVVFLGLRSSANDTNEQIRKYCEAKNYDFPVLSDDKNVVADYFGARFTPLFAVIDKQGILRYYGGFDDLQTARTFNKPDTEVKKQYVRDAINAVLEGKEVETKKFGGYG